MAHTPGPLSLHKAKTNYVLTAGKEHNGFPRVLVAYVMAKSRAYFDRAPIDSEAHDNARLLLAAFNAFEAAAKRLQIDPVEMAERMQDGEIADLYSAAHICLERWEHELTPAEIAERRHAIQNILARVKP